VTTIEAKGFCAAHIRRMTRTVAMMLSVLTLTACAVEEKRSGDKTITANAESYVQWNQKLKRAVPIGMSRDAMATLLRASGFKCFTGFNDGNAFCNKDVGTDLAGPSYHWRADFWVSGGRITSVKASFDHTVY
jgi:hypothetical protein